MPSLIRIRSLQKKLARAKLSAFLVTNPYNIYYFTGFRGLVPEERESLLLVDKNAAYLYVPRMYQAEARYARAGVKVKIPPSRTKLLDHMQNQLKKYRGKIGFEAENLKYTEYQILKAESSPRPRGPQGPEGKQKAYKAYKNFVSDLRQIKDGEEQANIQKAAGIADEAFKAILRFIKPGITEKQVARRLIELMEDLGAEGPAFEPIVAGGAGSALPHYRTRNRRIQNNEAVLLDFGAKVHGYCSDLTRVIWVGRAPKEFKWHYELVLAAQKAVLDSAGSHPVGSKLHEIALKTLGEEAKHMLHGVGHGVGLEIHEKPHLREGIKDKLEEGMVITIEPGLYYEGKYGIRIEDYGVVTPSGFQVLSKAPKELIEI